MGRRALVGVLMLTPLAACGQAVVPPAPSHAPQPRVDHVLTDANFGSTVVAHVGETIEVSLPDGWGCCFPYGGPRSGVLQQVSPQLPGPLIFVAAKTGSEALTAEQRHDQDGGEMAPANSYRGFTVVVARSDESFDVALSEDDAGKYLLLTPGTRVVMASRDDQLRISNRTVLSPRQAADHDSLSIFSAQGVGETTLEGPLTAQRGEIGLYVPDLRNRSFHITVLVRPAAAPYDIIATDRDGGRSLHVKRDQTMLFRMTNGSGFGLWTGYGYRPLVDPAIEARPGITTLSFLAESPPDQGSIYFEERPLCDQQPGCPLLARDIEIKLAVSQ